MSRALVQAALGGPIIAGVAWLSLVRWPAVRRTVSGLFALAAHAAAWGVVVLVYRGEEVAWRSFEPTLLGATILAFAELGMLLATLRADRMRGGGNAAAIGGLAVSASALAALLFAGSLAVVALALPIATIAAAGAALSGRAREDARGLIGLALADVIALAGLSLVYSRTGTVAPAEAAGSGSALLLLAAGLKLGAIPGVATWRLAATPGPGAWLDGALRGQGVALLALAALTLRAAGPTAWLAIGGAVASLAGGVIALLDRSPGRTVAAVAGAAAGVPLLALGLGGTVGARAFLLLFPGYLLAAAVVGLLGRPEPNDATGAAAGRSGWWTRITAGIGACALGVALGSMLGVPPGGSFPGTWLTVSLAASRGEAASGWMLAAAAVAIGLAVGLAGAVRLIRRARPGALALAAAVPALGLIYLGSQPIRLAVGWWIRVETSLALPEVLPTAGAPGLPAVGGSRLLLALAPAAVLVAAVIGFGRGVRGEPEERSESEAAPAAPGALRSRLDRLVAPVGAAARPVAELAGRARELGVGYGIAAVLELAALLLAGRIVLLAARAGFL